jgi:hypothetical protein
MSPLAGVAEGCCQSVNARGPRDVERNIEKKRPDPLAKEAEPLHAPVSARTVNRSSGRQFPFVYVWYVRKMWKPAFASRACNFP